MASHSHIDFGYLSDHIRCASNVYSTESEADDESLDNCNISNNASSDLLTSINSVPSKKGFKMAFLNTVSHPKNIDKIRHSMTNKHIYFITFNGQ